MPQLLELYDLNEMARTRGDATWAMLDWAAKQGDKPFTINDAYREFSKAGGLSEPTAFASIFNRFVAKYDPHSPVDRYRSQEEYGLSQKRPIVIAKQGKKGKGHAALYIWGLDGPLRAAPKHAPGEGTGAEDSEEDDHVGDAIDALERSMGRPALKAALERWRGMGSDHRRISADIRATVKPRDQMNAFLVATQGSPGQGGPGPAELPDESEETGTPFSPGKPRTDIPRPAPPSRRSERPAPEPSSSDAGDEGPNTDFDGEEPTNPDMAPPDFGDSESGEEPEEGGEEEGGDDEFDTTDYPDWLPAARRNGSPGEAAMYRLVAPKDEGGAGVQPASRLWRAIEEAEDVEGAREGLEELFARSKGKVDRRFLEDAVAVAADVLGEGGDSDDDDGAGDEEPEAGEEDLGDPDSGGEEAGGDEDGDGDEEQGEPEGRQDDGGRGWLPASNEDGSRAEASMDRLTREFGMVRRDPLFDRLRQAKDSVDAHRIITSSPLPKAAQRHALIVAKEIFNRDGRDWDTGEKLKGRRDESLSRLLRIYGESTEDDVVPDPSKRGRVSVDRVMPDFGMDEAQLDQVDFAVRTGLGRIMRQRG